MTTFTAPLPSLSEEEQHRQLRRTVIASTVGTTIEGGRADVTLSGMLATYRSSDCLPSGARGCGRLDLQFPVVDAVNRIHEGGDDAHHAGLIDDGADLRGIPQ